MVFHGPFSESISVTVNFRRVFFTVFMGYNTTFITYSDSFRLFLMTETKNKI